jgi:hypothetical protein
MRETLLAALGLAGAVAGAVAACGELSPADAPADGGPDGAGADGAVSDDGSASDEAGSGGDAEAGTENLLVNGGFEVGCTGWAGDLANVSASSAARTGGGSCLVCAIDGGIYSIAQMVKRPLPAGQYRFEVYVSAPTDGREVATGLVAGEYVTRPDGGLYPDNVTALGPLPDAGWQPIVHLISMPADGQGVRVFVQAAGGECFLVDDAALYGP